jgi:hypothetical protein
MEGALRDGATEGRELGLSAQDQARHDLDTWVQAYAAGKGIGAAALADIRQTDPARFRALVNEARTAWEATGEGQAHITQDGAITAPRAVDDVFAQGVGDRNRLLTEGWSELDTRHAAHEGYVKGQQPAAPGSAPDLKPTIARVSADEQAAFRQYQASEAGQKYQAGVALLASQAVRDEHGPLAPLRSALGILAPRARKRSWSASIICRPPTQPSVPRSSIWAAGNSPPNVRSRALRSLSRPGQRPQRAGTETTISRHRS